MRIEIQEVTFKIDELMVGYDEYGAEYCRFIRFFKRNKAHEEVIIPTFKIDEKGYVISRQEENEIKSVIPDYKNIWSYVSECIKASINAPSFKFEEKTGEMDILAIYNTFSLDTLYVYICYREDIPDCVGIVSHHTPLYKTKEN